MSYFPRNFRNAVFPDSAPNTRSLRYGSVSALGRKASHGCVRLRVEDAQWIYENCDDGTIVVVQ